eukprot:GHVP01020231.1.p2 GENE.GHVP01020231.1~~GHVP01020231.1.p2  ORF type:complete len:129 (+),score=19.22 GHVP01020231.1:95-481(+)
MSFATYGPIQYPRRNNFVAAAVARMNRNPHPRPRSPIEEEQPVPDHEFRQEMSVPSPYEIASLPNTPYTPAAPAKHTVPEPVPHVKFDDATLAIFMTTTPSEDAPEDDDPEVNSNLCRDRANIGEVCC